MNTHIEDQAVLNRIWSQIILEELSRFHVKDICFAPGSRSTPLTLEADENRQLTLHPHFDERGLGFMALGLAKASHRPVALIVTSGTATANLLPAIMEARLTGEKLIVLTADRPVELIDCGANQAVDQSQLYCGQVTGNLNLPSPSIAISPSWLLTSVDQLLYRQQEEGGVIHLNCPFPEPLYSDQDKIIYLEYLQPINDWMRCRTPFSIRHRGVETQHCIIPDIAQRKGVIVLGQMSLHEAQQAKTLAAVLGWPLLCDPQSGISSDYQHYDIWLHNSQARQKLSHADTVIQFGARMVSKRLNSLLKQIGQQKKTRYYRISKDRQRLNPDHLSQQQIICAPEEWIVGQLAAIEGLTIDHYGWAEDLRMYAEQVRAHSVQSSSLTELSLFSRLGQIVGENTLFIGNSLVIRLADMVSSLGGNQVYTNRGASGIDGLLATAAGVQRAIASPLFVLLGDTSALYDCNSLALFTSSCPVIIMVLNNDGGAIFDLLPVPKEKKKTLYQMPHGYHFKHLACQFGMQYLSPVDFDQLERGIKTHLDIGQGGLLIEIQTPPDEASRQIKQLIEGIHVI